MPELENNQPPPGQRALSQAEFLYSKKTYQEVFVQLIIDVREEHAEALVQGRQWRARWIRTRGLGAYGCAVFHHGGGTVLKLALQVWGVVKVWALLS